MASGNSEDIAAETVVHRLGGGTIENLRLSSRDANLDPPGLSILMGGTPQEAAEQMRSAFPRSRKWLTQTQTVGTALVGDVRSAGFEIVPNGTSRLPNHARLIHPDGIAGFSDDNLARLEQVFQNTTGC